VDDDWPSPQIVLGLGPHWLPQESGGLLHERPALRNAFIAEMDAEKAHPSLRLCATY
jgi:hypothetical protein